MSYSQEDQQKQHDADIQAQQETSKKLQGTGHGEHYFQDAAAEKMQGDATGHSVGGGSFENPGAAEYGGQGGVAYYSGEADAGRHMNDAQQASNDAAMHNSLDNMKGTRGPQSVENSTLSGRAAASRNGEIDALGMARSAALGQAPSAAAFQTKFGMNGILGQYAGAGGSAHGLAGLNGAQGQSAAAGSAAGDMAAQGAMARSGEIGSAIGAYGGLANQVRGQDLTRLGTSDQNNVFNAQSNDAWKLGNANLAAGQAGLGVTQGNTDAAWLSAKMAPEDKQFQYDQEMAAEEAGADADKAGASIAGARESKDNTRNLVNGGVTAGLGLMGSFAGPAGTAAGMGAGQAIATATKRYY